MPYDPCFARSRRDRLDKFGRRSLSVIAPLRSLHKIITDKGAAPETLEELRDLGLEVVVV
jgi:DeoR family transcriptional regulator of aga operon